MSENTTKPDTSKKEQKPLKVVKEQEAKTQKTTEKAKKETQPKSAKKEPTVKAKKEAQPKPTAKKVQKPKKAKKGQKPKKDKSKQIISTDHISLPGGKQITMNFTRWVMFITLLGLLILVLITYPDRSIKNHIKSLESKDEIVAYCVEQNFNCTFTELADYDIEGYKVARVAFLADDFFGATEETKDTKETGSGSDVAPSAEPQRNVYITIQKGQTIELPEE